MLVNVIQFKDSASVTLFENWIKNILKNYSIGKSNGLEQYKCPNGDTESVVNRTVLEQLEVFNFSTQKASECPESLIKEYNQRTLDMIN